MFIVVRGGTGQNRREKYYVHARQIKYKTSCYIGSTLCKCDHRSRQISNDNVTSAFSKWSTLTFCMLFASYFSMLTCR